MATAPLQQGSDPTFRAYNSDQAKQYSEARLAYPRELYDTILRYHADSNGRFENLVDAGCGPGKATRELAPFFRQAIGADPSEKMIQTACQLGGTTAAGLPVRYHVSTAEALCDLGDGSVLGRVDLLTAATAVIEEPLSSPRPAILVSTMDMTDDRICLSRLRRRIGSTCQSSGARQLDWSAQEEQ